MRFTRFKLELSQTISILGEKDEVLDVIATFFDSGKTKNLAPLNAIQLDDPRFSSYSDVPPFDLKDYATTIALQQLRFVSISDYEHEIKNTRVDIFDNCAVVTFTIRQTGMIVDNYSFRGQHLSMDSRGTFVLVKSQKWKIVHVHLSKISD
ncbi:MAG: nuclear transport factor 2 family protein [Nitrosotalea sp.]